MSIAAMLLGLWAAFAATHMGLSSQRLRPRLVASLGEGPFLGLYSLLALAIFVPLVSLYFANKHSGPFLWYWGAQPVWRWCVYLGLGFAFALMIGGLLQQSPASVTPGRAEVRGVFRVTRHPLLMSFALFGLLHLLVARVNAAELAFFGGFPLFVALGAHHQDRRKLATAGEPFARFHAQTRFWPVPGPGLARAVAEAPLPIALGAALAAVLRYFHPSLFG